MRENDKEEKVKHDMDEIKTINIELERCVAKLLSENKRLHNEIEHLKKIYIDQFDSIKKTRVLSKEHCDSLIAQLNSKSIENTDLKGQIQEKVFVTTTLQNELRRLKRKNVLDNATTITNATTIAPGMFKLDLDPLAPRLLKNKDTHIDYLKYTQEQADILQGIVEQAKAKQPLDNALDFACKHAKQIQELLVYVRDTCPNAIKLSEKTGLLTTPYDKVESSKTSDSNTSVLSSTGLKCFTSTCRSQPTSNKKNDMISQKPSSNIKNKVEVKRYPDCPKVSGLRMLKTYDRESLSAHELHITAGIKSLINAASITAAYIRVNAARLLLLRDLEEKTDKFTTALTKVTTVNVKVMLLKFDILRKEVIENSQTLPKTTVVEGVEKVMPITSAEDKAQRRLEVKARMYPVETTTSTSFGGHVMGLGGYNGVIRAEEGPNYSLRLTHLQF
ncbi:hypothetical protein Tco_0404710 [Tanacetum coccineum]